MTTGPPPPSSFNYPGSASSSSKRFSLPASPSQGPRPLHLLDLAGSAAQNTASPTTTSQSILSPTRLSLSLSGTNSPVLSPSPLAKELSSTSSSGAGPSGHGLQRSSSTTGSNTPRNLKRQSAISYFAPDHDSVREKEVLLKRTSSPLHATSGTLFVSSPSPRNVAGVDGRTKSRPASIIISVDEKEKDIRPPVTLAEKHAELLHFIAQKEAKCLELRSQLAMHEEELLQLKRKWERIVNRGLERENSISSPSPSSSNLHSTNPSSSNSGLMSLTNPALALEGLKEGVQGMSRFLAAGLSITSPSPSDNNSFQSNHGSARPTPKLGVPSPSISGSRSPLSTSSSPVPPSPLSISSTPLLVDSPLESSMSASASGMGSRGGGTGFVKHAANESNSSSATTGTSTVFSASSSRARHRLSTRSSRCSSESVTSLEEDAEASGADPASSSVPAKGNDNGNGNLGVEDHGSPQELMLSDTGATPTVSPNPAWLEQKARRRRRQQEEEAERNLARQQQQQPQVQPGLGIASTSLASLKSGGDETSSLSDVSWEAWGDEDDNEGAAGKVEVKEGQRHDRGTEEKKNGNWLKDPPKTRNSSKRTSVTANGVRGHATTSSISGTASPPNSSTSVLASSIPTFGAAAESIAGLSALASPQVSSWMGTVGKKIGGEMKKSTDALTRSQKRASLMFSDMSQSLVSALTSPPPLAAPTPSAHGAVSSLVASGLTPSSTPSPIPDKTFGLVSPVPRSSSSNSKTTTKNSLLDDDEDGFGPFLENTSTPSHGARGTGMQVMTPDVKVTASGGSRSTASAASRKSQGQKSTTAGAKAEDEEDEWNW